MTRSKLFIAIAAALFLDTGVAFADAPPEAIVLSVTADGFVPASVKVKAGVPVKLVITRKVKATCAREIVIKDYGVNVKLPFETPVEVTITPKKAGEIHYACSMDMIKGVLVVE